MWNLRQRRLQFPVALLDKFDSALQAAKVKNDIQIYDGVGHAFWKDMQQIHRGDEPQTSAYRMYGTTQARLRKKVVLQST